LGSFHPLGCFEMIAPYDLRYLSFVFCLAISSEKRFIYLKLTKLRVLISIILN
jgi:hypothetical protein